MIEDRFTKPGRAPWLEGKPEPPRVDIPLGERGPRRIPTRTVKLTRRFDWSELWEKATNWTGWWHRA